MPKFSARSVDKLSTCDSRLVEVLDEAIKVIDFSVLEGHRDKATQNELYKQGKSQLKWPKSRHNSFPSRAVDIAPYPIDWQDRERFTYLAGIIRGIAIAKGYDITWGGDWDSDGELKDNNFDDLPHFQIEG